MIWIAYKCTKGKGNITIYNSKYVKLYEKIFSRILETYFMSNKIDHIPIILYKRNW